MKTASMLQKLIDNLIIIITITWKDIVDALNNKIILSMILGLGFMLLIPKGMSWIIVPPDTAIVVYDRSNLSLTTMLDSSPLYRVQQAASITELEQIISSLGFGLGAEVGLVIPANFDQILKAGESPVIEGYVNWSNRNNITKLKTELEDQLNILLDYPVQVNFTGNFVYPPADSSLMLGILTITLITVMLSIGISLVPFLLFEEKQTKTIDALLVSPAGINQIIIGKALAGFFYVLVTAGIVFAVYWSGVVNWGLASLFVLGIGLFSVALGLVLGSFFERQQEVAGLIALLLVLFIGAMLIVMLDLQVPKLIEAIVPMIPSVALGKLFSAAFSAEPPLAKTIWNLGLVLVISFLLYIVVIWKIRRLDR
jgi:hypothetical protein